MDKAGTDAERFSELFVYELCRALGFPVAEYQNCTPYIRTKDFTGEKLNFEPAAYLVGDDEDYETNYRAFLRFGQEVADQYVELLLMDTICRNADRHTYGCGVYSTICAGWVEYDAAGQNMKKTSALVFAAGAFWLRILDGLAASW